MPEHAYDKANALDLSTYSVIEVIAPLGAGGMIAWVGPDPTLVMIVVMYLVAGLSLLLLRGSAAPIEPSQRKHLLREAWEGVLYIFGNPTLRGLAASYSSFQVAFGIMVVAVPVAVARTVAWEGSTEQYTGALWSLVGLCGAAGALVAGKALHAGREKSLLVAATLGAALAIYPIAGMLASLVTLPLGLALFGLLEGGLNVSVLSLRQRRTDPAWFGHVMTVSISLNLIGFPIGTLLGGVLVESSTMAAFAAAAGFAALASLAGFVLIPKEAV